MITLKAIRKIYQMGDTAVHALDGVNLSINRGEFVAITGPSGSGKSTLMNIIGCLDRPTSGSYRLDGDEVALLNDDQLALTRNRKIGFVFQNFNLLPRISAVKNIALPLVYSGVDNDERMNRALSTLTMVGIAERKDHRPNELSGGQRQRVAIARALVTDPAILIADEPTGNLDTKSSIEIMDVFCNLHAQGRTIIMVTHEADIAAYAQRVVHVRDGKILSDQRNADKLAI
ncbi:MAG: macB 6 [Firmicutes bacterium]|nr:macB 6 [Bacillota bacterium]